MCGIKALLTLGLLLTAADARPEGYGGVKGGRNHKSTANAFASAQATAHADGGYGGAAQSSASATANAFASGGTSNAAATANAYADGGNIGKVIGSDDANGYANPLGDSDNLRLSSVHAKDSENQSDNQEDGTSGGSHHNANTGSYGNSGSVGVSGQSQDRRPGCGVHAGVKGHRGAAGCTDRNVAEENKPGVSNGYPTYNGNPDSSGSKYPTSPDGGYGGNNAGAQPCTSGTSDGPKNKPSVSNPHPTYSGNPDSSADSKYPTSLDGGYGGNNAGTQPCTSGAGDCPKNKPSVSNPYPTYNGNPDSSGSKYPTGLDGGYGGNNAGAQPCTPGASGCPKNKPSVSNPYPTYNGNSDSSGSKYPTNPDGGYGGNIAKPEPPSCSGGSPGCSGNKPSASNPHAVYPGYTDSSPDSQHAVDVNHGQVEDHSGRPQDTPCFPGDPRCLAGSKPKPTTPDPSATGILEIGPIPCTSGSINCPNTKPGVANPHPTHHENPDLSGGSKYPTNVNGGYGGKTHTAGENPSSGSSHYPGSSRKPDTSNPFLNGEIDVSDIKDSVNTGVDSGIKTNPANPFLNPHSQVGPSSCTKHPGKPNGSCGGSPTSPNYPHGGSSGDSTFTPIKPNPSNPFLSHNGNVDSPNHGQQNTNLPTTQGYPTTNGGCHGSTSCGPNKPGYPTGSSEYPSNKPNPSNPFLSHNGNVDSTYGINHPGIGSGNPQNPNLPASQGYPTTNGGCHGSTSCGSNKPGHPTGSSEYPVNNPNPSNPFLPHNGEADKTTGTKYPDLKPPVLKNPGSFGESSYDRIDPHGNANNNHGSQDLPSGSSEYPGNNPNPSNPFLPHNGEADKTTGTKYPDLKPPVLKNPGSFGESSYDRIDPHSNVKKNHESQDLPSVYPGKEPTNSNPYVGDGQLPNPHPKPGSPETPNSPKPFPGHNIAESHSTAQYHGNGNPYGTQDQGVKTHQPGVKGGSRRREPPGKLQESELLSGNTGSAYSSAHASASASAHSSAYASSSSSSGGGHSNAKSDAYSDFGSSGSSNSWASSSASASASASAFASSSSHQGSENWQFPDVPAE